MENNVKNNYEKYWNNIYNIAKNNTNKNIEDIWLKITLNEFGIKTQKFNKNIYKYGKEYKMLNINDIKKGYLFSRSPFIDQIKNGSYESVLELGSGWGRNLFYSFMNNVPKDIDYYAFELTESGVNTSNILKKLVPDYNLYTDTFNINEDDIKLEKDYNNILISTFWSIEQITVLKKSFFYNILKLSKNITGIHIEPIGWQVDKKLYNQTDRNLMIKQKSYYNTNLYSLLKELEQENLIKITRVEVDFFNFFRKDSCGTLIIWEKI